MSHSNVWRAHSTLSTAPRFRQLAHRLYFLQVCRLPLTWGCTCRPVVQQHSNPTAFGPTTGSADFFMLFNSGLSHLIQAALLAEALSLIVNW